MKTLIVIFLLQVFAIFDAMKTPSRVVVVGGGAAGYFSAIRAAEKLQAAHVPFEVIVLESGKTPLSKVLISGGGRCNVMHDYRKGVKLITQVLSGVKVQRLERQSSDESEETSSKNFRRFLLAGSGLPSDLCEAVRGGEGVLSCDRVIMATGSSRQGYRMLAELGHNLLPPLPSLFSFRIRDEQLTSLSGVSSRFAKITLRLPANLTTSAQLRPFSSASSMSPEDFRASLTQRGPLLITQYGLSGPAALKLSPFGARIMAQMNYTFEVQVSWAGELTEEDLVTIFLNERDKHGNRNIGKCFPPLDDWMIESITGDFDYSLDETDDSAQSTNDDNNDELDQRTDEEESSGKSSSGNSGKITVMSRRLWQYLLDRALIDKTRKWSSLKTPMLQRLAKEVCRTVLSVEGRGLYKDEFVTCGGVPLKEVDIAAMESRKVAGLHLCGEVLDIDGITGGYNFQSAWTTGYIAGTACADSLIDNTAK
eukprot:gene8649-9360_t